MLRKQTGFLWVLSASMFAMLTSCATLPSHKPTEAALAYRVTENDPLGRHAPIFVIEKPEARYNLIGTPRAVPAGQGTYRVFVDPDKAVIFAEKRDWKTKKGAYTNLVYRVHFQEIPTSLMPFHIGAGRNVGLLVIVTLDATNHPILYTTLHTCGCYLAFIPTSFMPRESYPEDWSPGRQDVYGENLPGQLHNKDRSSEAKAFILLRDATHRVKDIWMAEPRLNHSYRTRDITIKPLETLRELSAPDGATVSFFDTCGSRKDYVVDSGKIWERLFMSWWAFDWRVGEDKRLGRGTGDGIVFYTSLKPWAREESDLRHFASFLHYWGWDL